MNDILIISASNGHLNILKLLLDKLLIATDLLSYNIDITRVLMSTIEYPLYNYTQYLISNGIDTINQNQKIIKLNIENRILDIIKYFWLP